MAVMVCCTARTANVRKGARGGASLPFPFFDHEIPCILPHRTRDMVLQNIWLNPLIQACITLYNNTFNIIQPSYLFRFVPLILQLPQPSCSVQCLQGELLMASSHILHEDSSTCHQEELHGLEEVYWAFGLWHPHQLKPRESFHTNQWHCNQHQLRWEGRCIPESSSMLRRAKESTHRGPDVTRQDQLWHSEGAPYRRRRCCHKLGAKVCRDPRQPCWHPRVAESNASASRSDLLGQPHAGGSPTQTLLLLSTWRKCARSDWTTLDCTVVYTVERWESTRRVQTIWFLEWSNPTLIGTWRT